MKQYRCIPIATGLPIAFSVGFIAWFAIFVDCLSSNDIPGILISALFCIGSIGFAIYTVFPAIRRVEFHSDQIVCFGLLPKDKFTIYYRSCHIGMDYHMQNGNKIWWIYIYEGLPPRFKGSNPANRLNAIKIKPGFVKVIYSDEVYEALMAVLPKKQCTALMTACRCAGFKK